MSAMAQRDMVLWPVDGNTRQAFDERMLGLKRSERGARSGMVAAVQLVHGQEQSDKVCIGMQRGIRPVVLLQRVRRVRGQANSSLSGSGRDVIEDMMVSVLEAVLRAA